MAPIPAHEKTTPRSEDIAATFDADFDWPNSLFRDFAEMQRAQLEALLAWQGSMTALQREMWDEWVCRFAGGAPIDA